MSAKPLTPEQIHAKKLAELEREKINKLAQFQREQIALKEAERKARLEALKKEREEKAKREAEAQAQAQAQEQKRKQEQSELQLIYHLIAPKFPVLISGYSFYSGIDEICILFVPVKGQYSISLESLGKIKRASIGSIKQIYQKLKSDIEWIEKYGTGTDDFNPYVDYVFDNFIESNQIDTLISDKERIIADRTKTGNWNIHQNEGCAREERELNQLRSIKKEFSKPREYYHVNGTSIQTTSNRNMPGLGLGTSDATLYNQWHYSQEKLLMNFCLILKKHLVILV